MADFRVPAEPDARALDFLEGKGVERSWRWSSLWREEHRHAFTLAGVWRLDVLEAAHGLVGDALREGQTYEAFAERFEARMASLGFAGKQRVLDFPEGPRRVELTAPWRVKVIYDTNLRSAYAAAEWKAIVDTAADFPALEYDGVPVEHNREHHRAFWGVVLPVQHPFWRTNYPPNGWHCRCYVIQVSVDELNDGVRQLTGDDELGGRGYSADPATWLVQTDHKTGRTDLVPAGVDFGFSYNVGSGRHTHLAQLAEERLAALPEAAAAAGAQLRAALPAARERQALEAAFAAHPELGDLDAARARLAAPAAAEGWTARPEALAAARAYTTRLHQGLNLRLRADAMTPVDEALRLLIEEAIDGLPVWQAAAWRSPRSRRREGDVLWEAARVGGLLDLGRQFQSAAETPERALRFTRASRLLIRIPEPLRGARLGLLSVLPAQQEVLFGADAIFRVLRLAEEEITFAGQTRTVRVIDVEEEG